MIRPVVPVLLLSVLSAGAVALPPAQQDTQAIPIALSDPARPASVRANIMNGRIHVRGEDRRDVLVTPRPSPDSRRRTRAPEPPPEGLRRLTQGGGLTITEENNQISISATILRQGDVDIQVPTRTNLNLRGLNGSEIVVENVEGDIEVNHLNGAVRLTNVAGSVVADSHNGNVIVTLARIAGDKAMAFTSFNGNIDVTLPATTKANLKMRSDNGDIFTDFDVQLQPPAASQATRRSDGRTRIDVNRAMYGAINGGGPEFELRTFNGNIYVRRGAQ